MRRTLLHLFHETPGRRAVRLMEAQLRAGHRVAAALLGGGGDWEPPVGCALHPLDPAGREGDADRLLDLIRSCDNATLW